MRPTETPVFRLTKNCIWNSFQSSGKKHLILTGGSECERNALLEKLLPEAGSVISGPEQGDDCFVVDLDDPFGTIGCVIMASGAGKRFGGNKLMANFNGIPMIQWALDVTEHIFAQRVVVTRHQDVQLLCKDLAIPSVLHDRPYRSDTVRLGLEALDRNLFGCVFCPGDQPLLTWETVASLALCAKNKSSSIWRPECRGTPGSPVYFPQKYFPDLRQLPEGKGGNVVVRKNIENVSYLSVNNPLELIDVDTRETLDCLAMGFVYPDKDRK